MRIADARPSGPVAEHRGFDAFTRRIESHNVAAVVAMAPDSAIESQRRTVAAHTLLHGDKPIVLVPRAARGGRPLRLRRLLLPLDGTTESWLPVQPFLDDCAGAFQVVVLHVFTAETAPAMIDKPQYDLHTWGTEFIGRCLPGGAASFEWRTGDPSAAIAAACDDAVADLAVLCWSQSVSSGHGAVVRAVIEQSRIPMLFLPAARRARPQPATLDIRDAVMAVLVDEVVDLGRPLHRCPACHASELRTVSDRETVNFLCERCDHCWHVELGWVSRVDPATCAGCEQRGLCVARWASDHPVGSST